MKEPKPLLKFDTYNLQTIERTAIEIALNTAGSIAEAAKLLGLTRHAVKRRIVKHGIRWSRASSQQETMQETIGT